VINAATNEIITTVAAGDYPCSITYNVALNKVYCSGTTGSFITVIDGSFDSVVARIDVAAGLHAVFCDPQSNKVYGGRDGPNVTVVDCAGDSLLAAVPAWGSPLAFCYNSQNNKIYYAAQFGEHVGVIDGVTDLLLVEVGLDPGSRPCEVCYNPTNNKVYCSDVDGDSVVVIDGVSDSIVTRIVVDPTFALCYSQSGNKVYAARHFGGVSVIDCATDSVVAVIPCQGVSESILFNAKSDKVFCAGTTVVTVIDAATDTLLRAIEVGRGLID
jgi:DNA-binding beta-propeller fold protein YncE